MSEYKYKISVVIPVYNCERYIKGCVESLKKQIEEKTKQK